MNGKAEVATPLEGEPPFWQHVAPVRVLSASEKGSWGFLGRQKHCALKLNLLFFWYLGLQGPPGKILLGSILAFWGLLGLFLASWGSPGLDSGLLGPPGLDSRLLGPPGLNSSFLGPSRLDSGLLGSPG